MAPEFEREDLAWAAGFFDGDGCFALSKSGRWAGAVVGGTDLENVLRFQSAVRCGTVGETPVRPGSKSWSKKPQYTFRCYSDVGQVVALLFPFLGDGKRAQAQRALTFLGRWRSEDHLSEGTSSDLVPSRSGLAWASGFFDAEGCFSFSPKSGVCASITNTDLAQLERFRNVIGFGKIYGPYQSKITDGFQRKPHYFFRVSGLEKVQALTGLLWFKIGSAKKAQARATLAHISATCRKGHPKKPGHTGCARCTAAYWKARRKGRSNGSTVEPATLYLTA